MSAVRIGLGIAVGVLLAGCSDGGLEGAQVGSPSVDLAGESTEAMICGASAVALEPGTVVHAGEPDDYDIRVDAATYVIADNAEVVPFPTRQWMGFESTHVQVAANGQSENLELVATMLTVRDETLVGATEVDVIAGRVEPPDDGDRPDPSDGSQMFGPVQCDGRGELSLSQVGNGIYSTHLVVQALDAHGTPVVTWVDPNGTGGDIEYHGGVREYWESMFDRPEAPALVD